MYVLVLINVGNGDIQTYGPYGDKRNAKAARALHQSDTVHAVISRLYSDRVSVRS